jgi:hypothetical protein
MPRSSRRARRPDSQTRELEDLEQVISSPHRHQRDPNVMEDLIERLSHINKPRYKFKPPKYSGETDIELFIDHFTNVARANRWSEEDTALHLRSSLEGRAAECGQSSNPEEIFENLRARYGFTAKQARTKLGQVQKKTKQTYQELGSEITRLVKIAYPHQGCVFQVETSLEIFCRALNHKTLQQHLLARPHETMADAIRICNEFVQIESAKPSLAF